MKTVALVLLSYGERRHKSRIVPCHTELENIQKMKDLHKKGHGVHEIAKILNAWGVPTKKRGRWDGKTVYAILKRRRALSRTRP